LDFVYLECVNRLAEVIQAIAEVAALARIQRKKRDCRPYRICGVRSRCAYFNIAQRLLLWFGLPCATQGQLQRGGKRDNRSSWV
jgi:hypothetical protein